MTTTPSRKELPDFTKGPIVKALIGLSIPIVFANLLQTAYQLVDTFWVGRLGAEAVAAVSLSFPVMFLVFSLAGGLAMAGTILVAQYKGKGDIDQVDYVSAQTLIILVVTAAIGTVIGYLASPILMKWMGAAPDVLPDATSYLQISFLGMIFMFGFFVYQSLMRGVGDVKTPTIIVFVTVLLNLAFDPLFILGWGPIPSYGVSGAAIATVGTQGIASLIGMWMLFSGRQGIHLKRANFKPDLPLFKKMFYLGFPASISQSARAFSMMLMTFLVATFGTITVASYGIGGRILSFIIIPAIGLSMATSTLVGQNIGAGKIDRADKITRVGGGIGFGVLTLAGILAFIFAKPLVTAFIPSDAAVIESGAHFVRIMAFSFGFMGLYQNLNGAFMGSGNTKASMILSLASLFLIQLPAAVYLSKFTSLGGDGVFWAFPITTISTTLLALAWYSTGKWKEKQITDDRTISKVIEETIIEEGVGN